jgi:hypothetical protein
MAALVSVSPPRMMYNTSLKVWRMKQLIEGILEGNQYPSLLMNIIRWRFIGCPVNGIQ